MAVKKTKTATVGTNVLNGYTEYEIDIERIIRGDLPGVLTDMASAPLIADHVNALPARAKGAYVLFHDDLAVYAGKTDTTHGFRQRLGKHSNTIKDRKGLDPAKVSFKAIRVLVFSNFDVEAILIRELRRLDSNALKWNDSGFGSNDPGRNREKGEPADFDKAHPIDIDLPIDLAPGDYEVLDLLLKLKAMLPYTLRFQADNPKQWRNGHADYRAAPDVTIPDDQPVTVRFCVTLVLSVLPAGWRATVFPDRVILYQETEIWEYALEYITYP